MQGAKEPSPSQDSSQESSPNPTANRRRRRAIQETHDSELDPGYILTIADPADRAFVDSFVQRINELAQEAVAGQSKFSATELLELARFRMASKAPRPLSNKVNPFNLFLKERKGDDNADLRKPAPGVAGINKGRPTLTGDYPKMMAEEYKERKAEFQQKAKEQNEAPPDKVAKGSDLKAYRKLVKKVAALSTELSSHGAHHVFMVVAQSSSPTFKPMGCTSDGYGQAFYKIMTRNECTVEKFQIMCQGGDLLRTLEKPAPETDMKKDALRSAVRDMIVESLSKFSLRQLVYTCGPYSY
jgi:hypothetical protein